MTDFEDGDLEDADGEEQELHWLAEARVAVEQLLESLELNPVTNEAGIVIPIRHKRDPFTWFSDLETIQAAVTEFGDSIALANAPFESGEPVFDVDTTDVTNDVLESCGVYKFFKSLHVPPDEVSNLIYTPEDYAIREAGTVFRVDVADINAELIAYLAQHPREMYELNPRKFEELVAELLRAKGYDVELTPSSGDGGKDVICTHRTAFGTMLIYVECKKYGPERPVGVSIVRSLYGVVEADRVTQGVIATTSRFTKGALDFHGRNRHRLSLQDFDALCGWLRAYRKPENGRPTHR